MPTRLTAVITEEFPDFSVTRTSRVDSAAFSITVACRECFVQESFEGDPTDLAQRAFEWVRDHVVVEQDRWRAQEIAGYAHRLIGPWIS
jgi:hypothetical protein